MDQFYVFVHKKNESNELLPFLHAAFEEPFNTIENDVLYAKIESEEILEAFEDLYHLWIDDLGEPFTIAILPLKSLEIFRVEDINTMLKALPYAYYAYDHLLFTACNKNETLKVDIRKRIAPHLSSTLISTIRFFAKNNMNVSVCAKNMYLHRNTLMYRLDQIDALTGLNPRNFEDFHVLYTLFY